MLRVRCVGAASLAALMAAFSAAKAEDAARPFELAYAVAPGDIIIVEGSYHAVDNASAMKTPTALIDIPQSLWVLSRDQLDDQAIFDIGEALRYTPGASVGQGEGHRDQITIRGQNTTADFFIDGLRDDVQYFRPLYNLERIEILKGPNALIFGRGGGGGVVNRVAKTPSFEESFTAAAASVNTFGAAYVSGDMNAALDDRAAVRLNAYYESLDNHRDFFEGDRYAVNPTIAFEAGPATQFVASYEYIYDQRVVDRGVPSLDGEPLRGFNETFFGDPEANITEFEAHIARARIDHEFSGALRFDATVQFADYDKLYQNLLPAGFDDVAGTVTLDGYRDTTERENLIVQSNLIGEFAAGPTAHTLLVGVEYGDQTTQNARRDVLFSDANDDVITFPFSDPLNIPAFSFPVLNRDRNSDVRFVSVYLQDQVDLGEHLKLVGGVRYDRFEIDVADQIEIDDGDADGHDGFLNRTDEEWSPRVGLIYKPFETASLYASFSRSFLPRSGDQFLTLSVADEALEPEKFENYEIGFKWNIAADLSLTAAVFRLDRESGATVDPNDSGNTILIGSRTRGVEIQLVGEILPGWSVNGGYSYLNAEERGRVVGGTIENRMLAQVPEHMFSLWNRYNVTDRLAFGLGVTHQSAQFASIGNSVELPGFTRVDAAAYFSVSENVELQVNVENLLDAAYFPAAHSDDNISTGKPLNARFAVRARF